MPMARNWKGLSIEGKKNRAAGRALVGIAMQGAVETKRETHRISGTLARSVHAAPVGYEGYDEDEQRATGGEDLLMEGMGVESIRVRPEGMVIEFGSWLPYACAEWIGRAHPGITQGLEAARGKADRIVAQAFREERL